MLVAYKAHNLSGGVRISLPQQLVRRNQGYVAYPVKAPDEEKKVQHLSYQQIFNQDGVQRSTN